MADRAAITATAVAMPHAVRGPWRIRPGSMSRKCWHVARSVGTGFVEYLGADGAVKNTQSNFRSEAAAERAIAKWMKRTEGAAHG